VPSLTQAGYPCSLRSGRAVRAGKTPDEIVQRLRAAAAKVAATGRRADISKAGSPIEYSTLQRSSLLGRRREGDDAGGAKDGKLE